jgi:hypothetical protein
MEEVESIQPTAREYEMYKLIKEGNIAEIEFNEENVTGFNTNLDIYIKDANKTKWRYLDYKFNILIDVIKYHDMDKEELNYSGKLYGKILICIAENKMMKECLKKLRKCMSLMKKNLDYPFFSEIYNIIYLINVLKLDRVKYLDNDLSIMYQDRNEALKDIGAMIRIIDGYNEQLKVYK